MSATLSERIVPWTAPDGARLLARVWNMPREPAGRVVYMHGIMSHSGWFSASCRRLVEAGQEVHFLDRRGAGLNWQARGDVQNADVWLQDVEGYLAQLPTDRPRTLLGLSWGGRLAAVVAARVGGQTVDRLGLLYPGLASPFEPGGWKKLLLNVAVASGLGGRSVGIPLGDPRLFTDSPAWQAFIARDPLALRRVTLHFLQAHLQLDPQIDQAGARIRIPTLVLLAGRDRVVDNARARRFYEELASPDKRLIEYPQAAHTLEFEPDPRAFLDDLAEWVSSSPGDLA